MTRCNLILVLALVPAMTSPAVAESFGDLGEALTILAFNALAYLVLIIILVVQMVRRRWRAFGWTVALAAVLVVGVPLADTGLLRYQQSTVAAAEIRKEPPDLTQRTILYINPSDRCIYSLCDALLKLRDGAPLYALAPENVQQRDFTQAIDLSSVDLYRYVYDEEQYSFVLSPLAPTEPRPAFDYVIIERRPYYMSRASNLEKALSQMPRRTGLGEMLTLRTLAAPIMDGTLDLARLTPDYLSFYIPRNAFAVPLLSENKIYGSRQDPEIRRVRGDWFCGNAGTQNLRYRCEDALDP